jgi:hypothetical protein
MLKKKYKYFDGLNDENIKAYEPQLWPFYAYEIIAPTIENQDLFVKFFLSIMRVENKKLLDEELTYNDKTIKRTKRTIKNQLPNLFSDELLEKIVLRVGDLGLIEQNKISLKVYNDFFSDTVHISNDLKKIVLLQDAVTGEVVPHIDFISDFNNLSNSNLNYEIKPSKYDKPSLLDIQKAYNYAKLIEERNIDNDEVEEEDDIWFDEVEEIDEDFTQLFFKDEEIVQEIIRNKDIGKNSHILFVNDQPDLIYFEFLPYSSVITNQISFLSPFFDSSNSWFTKLITKSRSINKDVNDLFEYLNEMSENSHKEYLSQLEEKINNDVDEEVEERFHKDSLYILIEKLNEPGLLRTFNEIQKLQHVGARTVYTEYVVFLEELFNLFSKSYDDEFEDIKEYVNQGKSKFKETLEFLAYTTKIEIPKIYYDKTRYNQISDLVNGKSNRTHFFLTRVTYLLLLEAYYKKTILNDLLDKDKKFLSRLKLINSARNSYSHYSKNNASYSQENISQEFSYVVEKLIKVYLGGKI